MEKLECLHNTLCISGKAKSRPLSSSSERRQVANKDNLPPPVIISQGQKTQRWSYFLVILH